MGNPETTSYGLPNKFLDFFAGYQGQRFGLCPFGKVIDYDHYILERWACYRHGPIKSNPQTAKGQGEVIGVSLSGCNLGMLENLWHLSLFLAKFMASAFIVGP